jgi:hypothetical protein
LKWNNIIQKRKKDYHQGKNKYNKKTTEILDMKTRLSALWLFAMLTYTYGDVVTPMDPVKHESIELT